jgi:mannitol-1-/sugar-/sorbitol-6-phosphatase
MPLMSHTLIQVRAILFDLDGTLVDTTVAVERTWRAWAAQYGVDPDAVLRVCHGRRTIETIVQFAPAGIDPVAETAVVEEQMTRDTDGVVPYPFTSPRQAESGMVRCGSPLRAFASRSVM